MALHPNFPRTPYETISPELRWFPADESLRASGAEKLMPPLVSSLRKKVQEFRESGYVGASETSRSLLRWWFDTPHSLEKYNAPAVEFQYFFAQRESLETIIYLYEVVGVCDKHDLMRFDSSGRVSADMFDETWRRFVVKMATGSGKTKVMSLALAWSFYHKLYEPESTLSRNFLVITPNIIVLDRIRRDFEGLRIFFHDPVIPDNGFDGRDWRNDFQLTVHVQDNVRITHPTGNIFLTNVHRIFVGNEVLPTADDENTMDYFLGKRPTGNTLDSKVDLGMIVRDVDELMVLNDEAHHIHDKSLAWFQSIQDIHHRMVQKGSSLSLQLDTTATPKHNNGAIFVQTITDYPLVEAIAQNVVKHPVLPDAPSRAKLKEKQTVKYTEKYADYIDLGVLEWRKVSAEHKKVGKKAILFVMTDDTKNCDDVQKYLEAHYDDLRGAVLVIHTKNNGDISETASGKEAKDLDRLRKDANEIDRADSPYKAIVSVMVLKEGWDVQNVTTIVGLRAYSAQSNILPEQTLGRGLRKMYAGDIPERVSVIGTDAFMEFVESIQAEGVELEHKAMGDTTAPHAPIVIEIDHENTKKDLDVLDIEIPLLSQRLYCGYKNLAGLDVTTQGHRRLPYREYSEAEKREIVFKDVATNEVTHTTILDPNEVADFRDVLGFFARSLMKELRMVSGYDVLYLKLKAFIRDELFEHAVELESSNTLRNLAEIAATKTVFDTFKKAVRALAIRDQGISEIRGVIQVRETRPFVVKEQGYLLPQKSVFKRLVWEFELEHAFINFLEKCGDVVSYAKNYFAVGFNLDYVNTDGGISNYTPDFLVKLKSSGKPHIVIVETKGREDLDVPRKMERLRQWCDDVNLVQSDAVYSFVYVDAESFDRYRPRSFQDLIEAFTEYQT